MNHELKDLLIAMRDRDLETRDRIRMKGGLYEGYDSDMESLHIEHAEKLNEIIDEHGWPGRSSSVQSGKAV